ncbi:MAG: bifunctional enoyl-CoA hydratase/phosphate acetyltransferase [Candidatus Kapabacteria bacterium]|nr:bifunctional enoyl-CoA hydratase/phosphate acetyltransferase [Ignavibacteriota bacterium]MCW5884705.1 bifunctional enoyl-CoA hydratase/phosphate acetyltransferase [Candidatus Kapabacteria bacterium]
MELKNLNSFIEIAKQKSHKKIAVAAAEDEPVLLAVDAAYKEGIADPILVGNHDKIKSIADKANIDISKYEFIDENDPAKSAKTAVCLIRDNAAQILMKGLVNTADYLRAILNKELGLRKGELLSHIGFFETPFYHKVIALTDAAQNLAPDITEKVAIINNSVDLFHRLGIMNPKIALIAAIEGVNPKMPATTDAAIITMMNRRKQIKGCIIDGPLAFDNAVSREATEHKGIISDVAGDADLIFTPNIEVGNALYKSFTYFGGATVAAVILGASVPIVLTSRADSDKSKLMSIALAASY